MAFGPGGPGPKRKPPSTRSHLEEPDLPAPRAKRALPPPGYRQPPGTENQLLKPNLAPDEGSADDDRGGEMFTTRARFASNETGGAGGSWDDSEEDQPPPGSGTDDPLKKEIAQRRAAIQQEITSRREAIRRSQVPLGMKASDVAAKLLEGMAEGAYASGIGLSNLVGAKKVARSIENTRDVARDVAGVGESDSALGTAAGVLGRLGYEGAEFMLPGSALGKVGEASKLGKVADYAKKAHDVLFPKGAGFARRVAGNVALTAPLDVVKAQDPESSTAQALAEATGSPTAQKVASTTAGRSAVEIAADIAGQGLFEGGAHVVGKVKAGIKARSAVRAAEDAANVPRLEKGAYEMGEPTVEPVPEPDVDVELYPQIQERRRLLAGGPKLLPARAAGAAIELPGEIAPEAKLAAAEREAMVSSARKTAANPPSSEDVVNRVLSNKDAETEAAMEKEITRRLNEAGVPRRSTPGQMVEEDVRNKFRGRTTAARSPLEAAQQVVGEPTPAVPPGPSESHPSMEQLSMLTPPTPKEKPQRYAGMQLGSILDRATQVVDRLNEAAKSPAYRARARVQDDSRILNEIEAELRSRGEIGEHETVEDAINARREQTAEREGAAIPEDQADTGFDTNRLATAAGGAAVGGSEGDTSDERAKNAALGAAGGAALGVGLLRMIARRRAAHAILEPATRLARNIGNIGVEMADRPQAIRNETALLNERARPLEVPAPTIKSQRVDVPERITGAAVKVGDQVFSGTSHANALDRAIEAKALHPDDAKYYTELEGVKGGFLTSAGRFVGDDEAHAVATKAGQWKGEPIDGAGRVESESLDLEEKPPNMPSPIDAKLAELKRRVAAGEEPKINARTSAPVDLGDMTYEEWWNSHPWSERAHMANAEGYGSGFGAKLTPEHVAHHPTRTVAQKYFQQWQDDVRSLPGGGVLAAGAVAADDEQDQDSFWRKPGVLAALAVGGGAYGYRAAKRGAFKNIGHFLPPIIGKAARNAQKARIRPEDVNPREFINVAKFALDPSGEQRLEQVVQRVVADKGLAPKQKVTWESTKRMAARIGLDPARLTEKHAGRLSGPEMLAIRNIVQGNVKTLEEIGRHLADPSLTDERRQTLETAMGMIDAQNDQLVGRFVVERSQTGRDLNNLKILAKNSLDPMLWFARAKKLLGERPLTDEHRAAMLKMINSEDRNGLADYVAKLRQPTWIDKLVTVWKAGLLTSPKTHIANLTGNTAMAALETAKDAPATLVDALLSTITGERTKAMAPLSASWRGAKQGVKEARQVLKTGSADGIRKWDTKEIDFDNRILDTYTKTVFRALDASDRVFNGMALQRSLEEQARVGAKNEGLRGSDYAARVRQLLVAPSDQMTLQAIADAQLATFRNRGGLAEAGTGARRGINRFLPGVGDFFLPFTTTPANIAERVVEYSPLGAVGAFAEMATKIGMGTLDRATQRKLADRLGRSAVGILPILAGYALAEKGLMTAGRPKSPSDQAEHDLEGKQENSVLVNGKWHSLERVSPMGNLVIFGAHLHRAATNPNLSLVGKGVAAGSSIGQTLVESSFMQGVDQLTEILKGDEEGADRSPVERFAESTAGSTVPNIVSQFARGADPTAREVASPTDAIKARIPGLSKSLPPKVNQLGHDVQRDGGTVAQLFDPTTARKDQTADDPTIAELARVGASLTRVKREAGEGRSSYAQRSRTYGRVLELGLRAAIQSDEYQQIPAIARALVEQDPRFAGRDANALAKELQRGHLEDVTKTIRRQLTVARKAG